MRTYFAYGSNMWRAQMNRRCPGNVWLGQAGLPDYRWIISRRGYASIVASPGDDVYGIVYGLTPTDEQALDEYEGVASGSYLKRYLPVFTEGTYLTCLVYIDPIIAEGEPHAEYVHRINNGIRDARLPDEYVTRYIRPYIPLIP